jgi:uncharacterized membrane protein
MSSQRGFDRVVFLSDAVVAIAATLLVLPLVDIASTIGDSTAGELLAENSDQLLAFALSFVVIFRFWMLHHDLFARLSGFTTPMVVVNVIWLMGIAFLPFPTELVSFAGIDHPGVSALYIGAVLVTTLAGATQEWLAARASATHAEEGLQFGVRGAVVASVALAIALVVALLVPGVGLWALLLLVPSGIIEGRLARRSARSVS